MKLIRKACVEYKADAINRNDGRKRASVIYVKYASKNGRYTDTKKFYGKKNESWISIYSKTPLEIEV